MTNHRGRKATAPLKLADEILSGSIAERSPWPKGYGPIEATSCAKPSNLESESPWPKGYGPIEARVRASGAAAPAPNYRGRKATAPLKHHNAGVSIGLALTSPWPKGYDPIEASNRICPRCNGPVSP